jgi:possible acetyltransferase
MQISVIDNMRQFKELLEVFAEVFEWEDKVVDDAYFQTA